MRVGDMNGAKYEYQHNDPLDGKGQVTSEAVDQPACRIGESDLHQKSPRNCDAGAPDGETELALRVEPHPSLEDHGK